MRSVKAFMIGAGAAYLFDPTEGKRRRHMLFDRTARAARKIARVAAKKARYTGGRFRGLVAGARRGSRPAATDDATVLQRIRSDAFREAGVSTKEVDVSVEAGVARLHGLVASPSLADDLVREVRKVPGVRDVDAAIQVASAGG
jgi:osmotically-inducible protein OsmY